MDGPQVKFKYRSTAHRSAQLRVHLMAHLRIPFLLLNQLLWLKKKRRRSPSPPCKTNLNQHHLSKRRLPRLRQHQLPKLGRRTRKRRERRQLLLLLQRKSRLKTRLKPMLSLSLLPRIALRLTRPLWRPRKLNSSVSSITRKLKWRDKLVSFRLKFLRRSVRSPNLSSKMRKISKIRPVNSNSIKRTPSKKFNLRSRSPNVKNKLKRLRSSKSL